jgi:hypothetical protein
MRTSRQRTSRRRTSRHAARRLSHNARPIRLDMDVLEHQVKRIGEGLQKLASLESRGKRVEFPPKSGFLPREFKLRTVRGEVKKVKLFLRAMPSPSSKVMLGAAFRYSPNHPNITPFITIDVNTRRSWATIAKALPSIRSALLHEATHASDVLASKPRYGRVPVAPSLRGRRPSEMRSELGRARDDRLAWEHKYLNTPSEVRAYLREIFEAIRDDVRVYMGPPLGYPLGKAILLALETNAMWESMEEKLTRKNRNLMLKALVTAFEDMGVGAAPAPAPARRAR